MKMMRILTGAGVIAAVAWSAVAAEYDIDFQAISDRRDAKAFEGPDMLCATNLPLRLEIKKGEPWRKTVSWTVKLPHNRGGDCDWAFAYRTHHETANLDGSLAEVRNLKDNALIRQTRIVESAWRNPFVKRVFTIPVGVEAIRVSFVLHGVGWLEISKCRMAMMPEPPEDTPIEIKCFPAGSLDNRAYVAAGQMNLVHFNWQTHPFRRYPQDEFAFDLDLPVGCTLREALFADMARSVRTIRPDGGETWKLQVERKDRPRPYFRAPFHLNRYATIVHALALDVTGRAGDEGDLKLALNLSGKRVSNTCVVRLVTIPKVCAVKPKRWKAGAFLGVFDTRFHTPEGMDGFSAFMADCGIDLVVHEQRDSGFGAAPFDPRCLEVWRRHGIGTVLPFWSDLSDGNHIGPAEGRPPEDRFVSAHDLGAKGARADKGALDHYKTAACMASVYEERPFFRTNTVPALARTLRGHDGIWTNWEPWFYKNEGCFCTNCRAKFAAFLGKDVAEVAATWPNCARDGGKWRKEAIAFRVREHAKMNRTLDKYVRQLTGENSVGLVHGVSFCEMDSSARGADVVLPEYSPRGYAGDVEWINPWGPYPHYRCWNSYVYYKRDVMRTWCVAKDIRQETDRNYAEGRRPKLLAMTQGSQGGGWIPKPGWFEMACDSFFFNGWHGMCPFLFPGPLDARWWKAYADATTRAAKYEDFVYDGRRVDGDVTLIPVAEYAQPNRGSIPRLPMYVNVPMLQHVAYDRKGVRIVAAFNFWDWAEAFFTLKATNLADGDWTVVDEKGRLHAPSSGRRTWTSAELAKGVLLSVPATTTRVFELRPAGASPADVREVVTASALQAQYESRRSALRKLADDDAEYEDVNAFGAQPGKQEATQDAAL